MASFTPVGILYKLTKERAVVEMMMNMLVVEYKQFIMFCFTFSRIRILSELADIVKKVKKHIVETKNVLELSNAVLYIRT